MKVITRFAPSPTGVLHTGSARTALFNYLFAKHHNGEFLLRIEDTDQERSKPEHVDSIIANLKWLGIDWDQKIYYQLEQSSRHAAVAKQLIDLGKAYYCYATPQEIEAFKDKFPYQKFISPWRDDTSSSTPDQNSKPTIRLKVDHEISSTISDLIQGDITVAHSELDDMVLLRSDGTPTYMLAVVVDDHDMGITHVIRGDDHLTNAFRQKQIYEAMGWTAPHFAHIPLIHDKDGHKLSKRRGAMGIDNYIDQGYLPEAVINHLLKLGWSHLDQEIFSIQEATDLFNLDAVGKSPARFDIDKLNFINGHYIRELPNQQLIDYIKPWMGDKLQDDTVYQRILKGMEGLKLRATTLKDLAESTSIYINKNHELDAKSREVLGKIDSHFIDLIATEISNCSTFTKEELHNIFEKLAVTNGFKFPLIMQSLRALILGTFAAPGIFDVMEILGKDECLSRISIINA